MGIIELGLIVGIALLISLAKMNWHWRLKVLSNPLLVDLIIFATLVILHWGTFSGVMVATIGAAACSVLLSAGRLAVGHYDKGTYVPGKWNISEKLLLN
jgi:hypothetical protein